MEKETTKKIRTRRREDTNRIGKFVSAVGKSVQRNSRMQLEPRTNCWLIEENRDNLRKERQEIEAKIIELNGRIPDKDCGSTIFVRYKDCGFLGC
jgi:hypothetical protein